MRKRVREIQSERDGEKGESETEIRSDNNLRTLRKLIFLSCGEDLVERMGGECTEGRR